MNFSTFFSNISMSETMSTTEATYSTGQPPSSGELESLAATLLAKLNKEEKFRQIPLTLFLVVLSVTGLLGNVLVCFIYGRVYKISNSRTFIMSLAVVDLFTCAIGIPMEIATSLDQYQFHSPWICKISRFMNIFTTITSAVVLVLIAMDRYRKICRSLEWQITNKHSKILCVSSVIAGLVLSWPAFPLYGIKSTELVLSPAVNGTSTECSIDDSSKNTRIPLIYEALHTMVFLVGVFSLVILYILIGRRVRFFAQKHEARRGSSSNGLDTVEQQSETRQTRRDKLRKLQSEGSSSDGDSNVSTETKTSVVRNAKHKISFTLSSGVGHNTVDMKPGASLKRNNSSCLNAPIMAKQAKCRKTLARNTTYLMFIISIVFILSFVPVLTLVLIREVKKDFVDSLSDSERTAYRFFLRSYYINAAMNPVIYSIFDRRFRKAVKSTTRELINNFPFCKS
ncbi:alpha-2Db adrenergic receptor-like [Saccostrea echinata]|uniref:alpha-2Db adrenergic receptor-like n=1 Tax=Saccostrea echinata TaxID=191078 RepID=UPI002A7EA95A|nr:alpha-2Db adrenergic receptor-like [Saccostrea echinata]